MSTTKSKAQELGEKPAHPGITDSRAGHDAYSNPYTAFEHIPGMTLRQHYAGLAMEGILAGDHEDKLQAWQNPRKCAKWAVEFADALLAELAGEGKPEKPFWNDELKMARFEKWADAKGHDMVFGTVEGAYVSAQTAEMFAAWIRDGEPGVEPEVPPHPTAIMVQNFQRWAISKGYASEMNFSGVDDRFASGPAQRLFETWKQAGMPES